MAGGAMRQAGIRRGRIYALDHHSTGWRMTMPMPGGSPSGWRKLRA
jgi:hypothetical protein